MTNEAQLDLRCTFGSEEFAARGCRADVLTLYREWLEMARCRGTAPRVADFSLWPFLNTTVSVPSTVTRASGHQS